MHVFACAYTGGCMCESSKKLEPWDPLLLLLLSRDKKKGEGKKEKSSLLTFSSLQIRAPIITRNLYANRVIITLN